MKLKNILYSIFIIFLLYIFYNAFFKINLVNSNSDFIKKILNDSNYKKKEYGNIFNNSIKYIDNINLKRPVSILENTLNFNENKIEPMIYVTNELDKPINNSKYINDPSSDSINNPLVYIYNTHQLESYNKKDYGDFNVTPNVMMASYILRDNLKKNNIETLVETNNITEFLKINNLDYSGSYNASRYYVKDTLSKYKNLKLLIDLHRDSVDKKVSTININNKSYAKVLFVIGLEHKNYKGNLETANKLNNILNKKYPGLSRGILKKEGRNVNGIYNQDLSNKIVLIEVGGSFNTVDEIMNTSIALSGVIKEYLEE